MVKALIFIALWILVILLISHRFRKYLHEVEAIYLYESKEINEQKMFNMQDEDTAVQLMTFGCKVLFTLFLVFAYKII